MHIWTRMKTCIFKLTCLLIHTQTADLFDRYSDVQITGFTTFPCQTARVPIRRKVSFPLKLSSGLYSRSDFTPSGNGPTCFVFSPQGPFCCRAPYARQGAQRLVAPALAVNTSGLEWGKEGYEGVDAFLQCCSGVNGVWVCCRSKCCWINMRSRGSIEEPCVSVYVLCPGQGPQSSSHTHTHTYTLTTGTYNTPCKVERLEADWMNSSLLRKTERQRLAVYRLRYDDKCLFLGMHWYYIFKYSWEI